MGLQINLGLQQQLIVLIRKIKNVNGDWIVFSGFSKMISMKAQMQKHYQDY